MLHVWGYEQPRLVWREKNSRTPQPGQQLKASSEEEAILFPFRCWLFVEGPQRWSHIQIFTTLSFSLLPSALIGKTFFQLPIEKEPSFQISRAQCSILNIPVSANRASTKHQTPRTSTKQTHQTNATPINMSSTLTIIVCHDGSKHEVSHILLHQYWYHSMIR